MVCTQEELRSSKTDEKELRILAERIYDLDTKVYENLGSSLGRVFTKDKDRCVDELVWEMLARNQGHIVRSDLALISNMARTVRNRQVKKELMRLCGVGEKVAECVCLFGFHHVDAFPVDTHIAQVLKAHYPEGFPFKRYKGFAGILQQYMFYYELHGRGSGI